MTADMFECPNCGPVIVCEGYPRYQCQNPDTAKEQHNA